MPQKNGESLHQLTRSVYEKQHERIAKDDATFDRIYGIYENTNFGIDPGWWSGKTALDAGCGNFGAFMLRLIHLGFGKVTGIDLGESWIEKLRTSLETRGVSNECFELRTGSVLDIPYPDGQFDFVAINGVLVHLDSMEEIEKGFAEGARVCKKGGYFFTTYGPCGGALMDAVFPALQQYYRRNDDFKSFIDTISPDVIHDTFDKVARDHKEFTGESLDVEIFKGLLGLDFCVFLQNFIQRPTDFSNECTPGLVENMYKSHGFGEVKRLHHYVKRTDIRKLFAPLHYDWNHPVAKALYGSGFVQYIGRRDR
jgi:ubiquinone/menaquinone biosynthesis C-methylase UbiE